MMTGATGKSRMNREANAKASHKWRTLALSSGEQPLGQLLRDGQNAPRAGQLVRAIDIPVGDSAFEAYPDFDAKAFADRINFPQSFVRPTRLLAKSWPSEKKARVRFFEKSGRGSIAATNPAAIG
jgi:hypothetical protein